MNSSAALDETEPPSTTAEDEFTWTPTTIVQSIFLFFLADAAEIVGGWMIW
jgi:hypothetical protein